MAEPGRERPTRSWLLGGFLGAAVLVIALALLVVGSPAATRPQVARIPSPKGALTMPTTIHGASCGTLSVVGELLGTCGSPATNAATTPGANCDLVQQRLSRCGGPPPATTTSTTTTLPASTTTSSPVTSTTTTTDHPTASSGGCGGTSPPIAPPSGTWACTFGDEFNGTSLDTSKWQPVLTSTSGYESGPLLSPVCYVDNPSTISESGGYLNLSVVAVSPSVQCNQPIGLSSNNSYEGGMIASYQRFSQKYGYFEVRAQMPPTSVPGLQETLWLYPENMNLYGPWPDSGEIDYAEFYSSYSQFDVPAVHYPGSGADPNATTNGCSSAGQSAAGQFNTYALSWTPTTITTYFNGVPCTTDTYGSHVTGPDTAPEPFNQPFFLAFTSALGMNNGDSFEPGVTPVPATMKIDWVRVWQY